MFNSFELNSNQEIKTLKNQIIQLDIELGDSLQATNSFISENKKL